jgi:hypothetical protein
MFSEIFWTFLVTTVSGCCLVMLHGLIKSKCKVIDCCGLHIERDIEAEAQNDRFTPLEGRL